MTYGIGPFRFVNNREQFRSDLVDGPPQGAVDDLCVHVQRASTLACPISCAVRVDSVRRTVIRYYL